MDAEIVSNLSPGNAEFNKTEATRLRDQLVLRLMVLYIFANDGCQCLWFLLLCRLL